MSDDEKSTPPVPPSDHMRVRELDKDRGSRVVDSERLSTKCPRCDGTMVYQEVATGEMMMASWDREAFDPDEFRLSTTYERTERFQRCDHCGWRVDL